jgi:hypothetical protein
MTISTTESRISYNGNGVTTEFAFPYRFFLNADLTVILVDVAGASTTLVLNTDYTVAGANLSAGGTVTLSVAPAVGERLVIARLVPLTQEVDYITGDPFPAETHEGALDKLTTIVQQQQEQLSRTLQLPIESDADASTIDPAAVEIVAGIAADVTTVALNNTNVTTVATNDANVTTVATNIGNVNTVAGISADVTAVVADQADIGIVATNIANVNAVGTNIANVIAVDANETNINAAVANAANINTVAADGADIGTVAANIASVNTVATNDANVTTVATNIADVNTVAANIGNINTAVAELPDLSSKVPRTSTTGSAVIPTGTEAQRDVAPAAGYLRFNADIDSFEGYDGTAWGAIGGGATGGGAGLFYKTDPTTVAFDKTGTDTVSIKAGTQVDVAGTVVEFAVATAITMPALVVGTDYAIWVKDDATIEASSNHSSAPAAGNWRKIGGFHYAPGGNATAQAGGNTTAQINEYSFWDLKFRPACPDPRGMTLVADAFWSDIYLTGVDHHINGTSKYNVTIADGSAPPKVPLAFGGNGSTAYSNGNWWHFAETLRSHGKRLPTYSEFAALAYGTTEAVSSGGTDVPTTGVNGTGATSAWNVFTSKWGVVQSSGCLYTWGDEFGGGAAAASWTANTGGRGSTYQMENAARFGGAWDSASNSGSRCSRWANSPAALGQQRWLARRL